MSVNLKAERLNRGLSIRQAASEIDVTPSVLQRAEAGASIHPKSAFKIAEFYGYRVTDLWPVEEREAA